jgi:hypothetical protein
VRRHGDSYIDARALGGECVGVFTFRCENRAQSETVEQPLRLGALVNGVQLGANLHRSLENASRSSTLRYDFRHEVWGCGEIPALTPDTMEPCAMGFHAGLIDQPILPDRSCKGYETLAVYVQPADPGLIEGMERLRTDLAEIASLREADRQDPAASLAAPTLEAVAVGSPRLQVQIRDGELMGGGDTGNTPLDWRPAPNQVLLGFNGRSEADLDALQAGIATLGPLAWEPVREEEDG